MHRTVGGGGLRVKRLTHCSSQALIIESQYHCIGGSYSPLTDLELISWPLLLHFCQLQRQFGVCCSDPLTIPKCTRTQQSPRNSRSLGVLCCASSNFCRAKLATFLGTTVAALFSDRMMPVWSTACILGGFGWSKRSGTTEHVACVWDMSKESACWFRKIDHDISLSGTV